MLIKKIVRSEKKQYGINIFASALKEGGKIVGVLKHLVLSEISKRKRD